MKKIILSLLIAITAIFTVSAKPVAYNETSEENWSKISYTNIPILKILDSRDAYVVIYQKNKIGVGQTVIPKNWSRGNPENPRKLKIRNIGSGKLKSFITVVKKEGEFHHVVLSVPANRQNPVWGVISYKNTVPDTDKETLEELDL